MSTLYINIACLIGLWNLKRILKTNPDPMYVKYEGSEVASDYWTLEQNLILLIPKFS